jgi:hypothetical protein
MSAAALRFAASCLYDAADARGLGEERRVLLRLAADALASIGETALALLAHDAISDGGADLWALHALVVRRLIATLAERKAA